MARLKDIAVGVKDLFMLDPAIIQEEDGWNVRQPSADLDAHIRQLADSIREIGVQEPVTVYLKGDVPILTNGHCRLMAVRLAIKEGAEIKAIPARAEERYANDADRVLGMITRNSGKPLTSMEQSEVVKRLMAFGWSIGDVVSKTGFSRTHINNLLSLSAAPAAVTELVKSGKVSARTAVKALRSGGEKAQKVLMDAVKVAKDQGKSRATEKHFEKPVADNVTTLPYDPSRLVRWIRVTDYLPEPGKDVLTFGPKLEIQIWPAHLDVVMSMHMWCDSTGSALAMAEITHWMSFPDPPSDAEQIVSAYKGHPTSGPTEVQA